MQNYPKNNFKSSSIVLIPAIPKFSTSTFTTFDDKNVLLRRFKSNGKMSHLYNFRENISGTFVPCFT